MMKSKPGLSLDVDDATKQSGVDDLLQSYKQSIIDFTETPSDKLSDELEQFLLYVAKTGEILANWDKVQKVFILKLKLVLDEFYESQPYKAGKIHANCENDPFDEMKGRLIQLAEKFESPPFTIQRLCELMTNPRKNYTKCEKFMRALEKNLMVVTSWTYPTRRNSESAEQINGAFETRSSFSAVDRPWAALPSSPAASGPSTLPPFQLPNDATSAVDGKVDDVQTSDVKEAATDEVEKVTSESTESETTLLESKETVIDDNNPSIKPDVSEKQEVPSSEAKESDPISKPEQVVMAGDTGSVTLTNTEKDALREPLPGVSTLMEKHSVKSSPSETPTAVYEIPSSPAEKTEVFAASPKRKLEDEEVPMEAGTPSAKRLKSSSDDPIPPMEETDA